MVRKKSKDSLRSAPQKAQRIPSVLNGSSSREILHRLMRGDPLGLDGRCRKRISERAQWIDVQKAVLRTAARVAFEAPRYSGFPPLSMWLERLVERSLDELTEELRSAEASRSPVDLEPNGLVSYLSETLGVSTELARRAAVVFNDLPSDVRRCYWRVVVESRSIDDCADMGLGPRQAVEESLRRAVLAISCLEDPGPSWPSPPSGNGREGGQ